MLDVGFNPMGMNPFTMRVMQSSQDTDNIMYSFEQAYNSGLASQESLEFALKANNVDINDLTANDLSRLERRIEAITGSSFNAEEEYR